MIMEWMDRFVDIMDFVSAASAGGVSITELSVQTGLSKGSLHRVLQDMVAHNLLTKNVDTKKYCLGVKPLVWGSRFVQGQDPAGLLAHYCDALAERTGLYTFLCRINEGEIYCIYTKQPDGIRKKYFVHVGQRMPLHCTAAAKSIIAFLPQEEGLRLLQRNTMVQFTQQTKSDVSVIADEMREIKTSGVAFCLEELEVGVSGMSVPIFVAEGKAAFSISLLGDAAFIWQQRETLTQALLCVGSQASEQMRSVQLLTSVKTAVW